ncbi:MAG: acyl-CoA thioester hydrolase [Nonlabens sp.]|jgi:acyl-CoA thioester hydrolase|uniref:acyl-CoA thioesterase n=1 Tax=Nonlabens sp. TaxID=1888209 RepID=UPI0039E223B1
MLPVSIKINPRYSETDQMGIIHHANYLIYLEQARLEWLEQLGFSYAKMEKDGVLLPVYNIDITYKKPIKLGDKITVRIKLKSLPTTKVIFDYEIVNQRDQICSTCELTLVFTDAQTFRPRRPIANFLSACQQLV